MRVQNLNFVALRWANCPCNLFPTFPTYVILIHQRVATTQTEMDGRHAIAIPHSAPRGNNWHCMRLTFCILWVMFNNRAWEERFVIKSTSHHRKLYDIAELSGSRLLRVEPSFPAFSSPDIVAGYHRPQSLWFPFARGRHCTVIFIINEHAVSLVHFSRHSVLIQGAYSRKVANSCRTCDVANRLRSTSHVR